MEKLYRLLRWIIVGFIFTLSLNYLGILLKIIRYFVYGKIGLKKFLSIDLAQYVSDIEFIIMIIIIELFLTYLIFSLIRLIYFSLKFNDNKLFSERSHKLLSSSGKVILFVAILFIGIEVFIEITSLVQNTISIEENLLFRLGYIIGALLRILYQWIPLLMLGVISLLIAQLIEKGLLLKSENDLTI